MAMENGPGLKMNFRLKIGIFQLSYASLPGGIVFMENFICAMVKSRYIGDGHPTFNRNPYNGYINPYYWVDEFIPYYMEIMGVFHLGTYEGGFRQQFSPRATA